MGRARDELRRQAEYAQARDYESGVGEVVPEDLPQKPCEICQTLCVSVGPHVLCEDHLPETRLR